MTLNPTHDATRRSWIESANEPGTDFPLQNLPLGLFRRTGTGAAPALGVAIGSSILDVRAITAKNLAKFALASEAAAEVRAACQAKDLSALMALGPEAISALRRALCDLLDEATCPAGPLRATVAECLLPAAAAEMMVPTRIGGYTDFYASRHHAARVGAMFRPERPLLPNYAWVPIGYHGRASSIVVSGTAVRRPSGQTKTAAAAIPSFGPSTELDYELELGAFIGPGSSLATPISLAKAEHHLFGLVLLNDWSARDIQSWEYQPLGPFLSKSFATSISPWVVTMEALAPFRVPAAPRPNGEPRPLPYLSSPDNEAAGGLDIIVEAWVSTQRSRASGASPVLLSTGRFREVYWTLAQLVTHHTSNGCNLSPGDLLGSGTISGPTAESCGCLLELTQRGTKSLRLANGETRGFLEDGDEIILRGYAERPGFRRIGFGECRGVIQPAH
ncbi:MAG TPA: fumarylacetoacetase [Lacunisphaera sp.]|jgi:fumarylacetoacetase|nr:fumarylacetoacetase [Lacunisphaera sp.]